MAEYTSWRKSSRSNSSGQEGCVECRQSWRKSLRSGSTAQEDCVEARNVCSGFQVRDSKLGHGSPVFDLAASDYASLLRSAQQH
ncbi:DUF397 domain-containing protein [Glycomyces sp. NRRL B-16210]|uniref:DUF397 domain-containing protein n=1 Tax=Glycomyces sp. NRRL B-16210 TaxID=1463821 RepID=UPI0009DCE22C|nr:DUF397 domain-containing protein [Glycomyces sp. NRRL B-16210]